VGEDQAALELLSALAKIGRLLGVRAAELNRAGQASERRVKTGLHIRESEWPAGQLPPGAIVGTTVSAFLALEQDNGSEVEWSCSVFKRVNGSDWVVERDVDLNESPVGESVTLAAHALPTAAFSDTLSLARALPNLIEELLRTAVPERPTT
jgi:hypothetical protein